MGLARLSRPGRIQITVGRCPPKKRSSVAVSVTVTVTVAVAVSVAVSVSVTVSVTVPVTVTGADTTRH